MPASHARPAGKIPDEVAPPPAPLFRNLRVIASEGGLLRQCRCSPIARAVTGSGGTVHNVGRCREMPVVQMVFVEVLNECLARARVLALSMLTAALRSLTAPEKGIAHEIDSLLG
jgi:hypothetical protein